MKKDLFDDTESFDEDGLSTSEKIDEIYRIVRKWSGGEVPFVGDIRLDKTEILRLMRVSTATLARWRCGVGGKIPYKIDASGNAYYMFDEVYSALQTGKICARGFDRIAAMARMKLYRDDYIRDLVNNN